MTFFILPLLLLVLLHPLLPSAKPLIQLHRTAAPNTRYILQLTPTPRIASLHRLATSKSWETLGKNVDDHIETFLTHAKTSGVGSLRRVEGYEKYRRIFTGLVVEVKGESEAETLRNMKGVKGLFPVRRIAHPYPNANSRRLLRRDTKANDLVNITSIISTPGDPRGKGIRVCVIDSGVDYTHPALGGCFGKGCKVEFGYDFVGDDFDTDGDEDTSKPKPKDDPMDCSGHGTHVAGIIASDDVENRGAMGVAPNATLGVYKVFGCNGSSDTAAVLAAMDRSFYDECSILNLSLGGGSAWSDTPDALLADVLSQTGEIIVSSAGNEQELGIFRVNAPAVSFSTTAVGAVENSEYPARVLNLVNDTRGIPFTFAIGKELNITNVGIKASNPVNATMEADGCEEFPAKFFEGLYALIRRGTCYFDDKIRNVQTAGALGIILYNKFPEPLGEITSDVKDFPVFTISGLDGEYLISRLQTIGNNGQVQVQFDKEERYFPVPGAGKVTDFSSWGPSLDWRVKPDILTPGGNIFSTWLTKEGKYAILSGTSMASPFQAGAYALYLSSIPNYTIGTIDSLKIRDIMKTTANPTFLYNGTRGYTPTSRRDVLAPVALQGSGLLNVSAAINASTFITPTSIFANVSSWSSEGTASSTTFTVSIFNDDIEPHDYTFLFREAALVSIDDPFNPLIHPPSLPIITSTNTSITFNSTTLITLTPPFLSIPSNTSSLLTITITPPSRSSTSLLNSTQRVWLYSGYIQILDSISNTYTISLHGTVGDFSLQPPLETTPHPPYISPLSLLSQNTTTRPTLPTPLTFNRTDDMMTINLHLRLPSPLTRIFIYTSKNVSAEVLMKRTQASVGASTFPEDAVAASPATKLAPNERTDGEMNLYTTLVWDGTRNFEGGEVVGVGEYRAVVAMQGVYGNGGVWSGWVSPVFRLVD